MEAIEVAPCDVHVRYLPAKVCQSRHCSVVVGLGLGRDRIVRRLAGHGCGRSLFGRSDRDVFDVESACVPEGSIESESRGYVPWSRPAVEESLIEGLGRVLLLDQVAHFRDHLSRGRGDALGKALTVVSHVVQELREGPHTSQPDVRRDRLPHGGMVHRVNIRDDVFAGCRPIESHEREAC